MRIAAQVLLAYALVLIVPCVWRVLPFERAVPDVVALTGVYLGLTARQRVAAPTFGAVISGYLADLLIGTPRGLNALVAGTACILGHVIHRRLLVRGWLVTIAFSFFTGLFAQLCQLAIRAAFGLIPPGAGAEPWVILSSAVLAGLLGPLVFWLCRAIDSRFARTQREREGLEGLSR